MKSKLGGRGTALVCGWLAAGGAVVATLALALANPLPTTLSDFYLRGTQPTPPFVDGEPNPAMAEMFEPLFCAACHGEYDESQEPYARWQHSMMGQAFRDPVFRAAMSIGQQDAPGSGDTCLRCHAPSGWTQARNLPSDGSGLDINDKEGVSCHHCHRQVDPTFRPGVSPMVDAGVLTSLASDAPNGHLSNGYVIDPKDRRRGPYDISPQTPHLWLQSPLHRSSDMCASCHDTSNPAYVRQPDGTYAAGAFDAPHPTLEKYDMFPEQRTYSEWAQSAFAAGPVEFGASRYGGQVAIGGEVTPQTAYSTCQDCHMPRTTGMGCNPFLGAPVRLDLPQHNFNGANTWVLPAIESLYPPEEHHMLPGLIADAQARTMTMLAQASDLELSQVGSAVVARVINQTGHKLPTGYPEGRRMWLNVRFLDGAGNLLAEHGRYDAGTAHLTTEDTKVYETHHGVDAAVASLTGVPAGPSFHLTLNNVVYFDNRIPPRGFTNAGFASVQSAPVAYTYADGQYWDDTAFVIPEGASRAEVRVYYQTSSKEYMEFLRDTDVTIPFDRAMPWGRIAYDAWVAFGKSAPALMDFGAITLSSCAADFNGDGNLDADDLSDYITAYFSSPRDPRTDFNHDGQIDADDLSDYITAFFTGCL